MQEFKHVQFDDRRSRVIWKRCFAAFLVFWVSTAVPIWGKHEPRISVINIPGATSVNPTSINDNEAITGFYEDGNGSHGFVRSPYNVVTSFDISGAFAIKPAG